MIVAKVTFTLKNDNLDQYLGWFVAAEPIPMNIEGPQMTPAQWWKAWVIKNTKQAILKGKKKLETTTIDEDVIT